MICTKCGNPMPDGAVFCGACGNRMDEQPVAAPVQEAYVPQQQETAAAPATPVQEAYVPQQQETAAAPATPVQPAYEAPVYEPAYVPAGAETAPAAPAPKKKSMAWLFVLIGAAALALCVVLAGVLTGWFGLVKPVRTVLKATEKTLLADNFTMELKMYGEKVTVKCSIDVDNKTITAVGEDEDGENVFIIYDNYVIEEYDGEYYYQDVSEDIEPIFDYYEEGKENKFSAEWITELLDEAGAFDGEEIDKDEFEKCLGKFMRKADSTSWLKKNAGYKKGLEKGATVHSFDIDAKDFGTATLKFFEPCFEDEDDYEDAMDELDDLDKDDYEKVKIEFSVKGGKLVGLMLKSDGEKINLTFSDIGKTDIDYDELDDMLDAAEEW